MKKVISKNAFLIPDKATLAFQGKIFDVYQWPQEMFNGSIKTFEMMKRVDTVQVIAIKDGKVVIVEDQQPGRPMQVHLPGGRPDEEDDNWLDAAKRELREETGMTFKKWRHVASDQPAVKIEWFTPIFVATEFDQLFEQQFDPDGEKISVKLQPFDQVRSSVLSGNYPMMSYFTSLFAKATSLEALLDLPEFKGQEVDR